MTRALTARDLVFVLVLAVACAARRPPAPTPAAMPGELVVTLVWSAPVDLDLYVTDPGFETVYFANPRSRSGGVLERDARCADAAGARHEERIRWTVPAPGRYRVGVDYLEACARAGREVPYRILVEADGRHQETEGRARRAERDPRVVDVLVVGAATTGGSR